MQQAARASDDSGFMLLGELIEFGSTERHLHPPQGLTDGGLYYREVWVRRMGGGPGTVLPPQAQAQAGN